MKFKNTLADLGFSIGVGCGLSLALSTATLIGSLSFQGIIWVGNGLERIEEPIKRVGIISGLIMGASAVGCVLGALTSRTGKDADLEEIEQSRNKEMVKRGIELSELQARLDFRSEQLNNWIEWWALASSLPEGYDIIGCKGCQHFIREFYGEDNPNFFVCAMHPCGQRKCKDKK